MRIVTAKSALSVDLGLLVSLDPPGHLYEYMKSGWGVVSFFPTHIRMTVAMNRMVYAPIRMRFKYFLSSSDTEYQAAHTVENRFGEKRDQLSLLD
jgi:hypothetical protein